MIDDGLLKLLWERQQFFCKETTKYLLNKNVEDLSTKERIVLSKDYILSLVGECKEALDTFSWKIHRLNNREDFDKNLFLEETIDIQKYLWGLMGVWSITLDEFVEMFLKKSQIVEERWKKEILKK